MECGVYGGRFCREKGNSFDTMRQFIVDFHRNISEGLKSLGREETKREMIVGPGPEVADLRVLV